MNRLYILLCFISLLFACKKTVPKSIKNEVQVQEIPKSVGRNFKIQLSQKIDSTYFKRLKDWEAYFTTEKLLISLDNTSENNIREQVNLLVSDAEAMKKTLNIKALKVKGMLARLNGFNNEVLRLQDMTQISSIKADELEIQTQKVAAMFDMVTAKANHVYKQLSFEETIDFDETYFKILDNIENGAK